MRKFVTVGSTIGILLVTTGCGVFTKTASILVNEPDSYVEAESVPSLVVPEDMDDNIENNWIIPDIAYIPSAKLYPKSVPAPVALIGDADPNSILIQKLGERRWMVVQRKPESVWPMLLQYLNYHNIALESDDPELGTVVSGHLNYSERGDEDFVKVLVDAEGVDARDSDFLVYKVEQGIRRGTTEVHLRYAREGQQVEDLDWGRESEFGTLEGKLLTQAAEFDTSGLVEESISLLGQTVASKPKAEIVRDALGYPLLILNVDPERAWATIGQALKEAEIGNPEIDEETRKFTFPLDSLLGEEKGGILSRLIPGGSPRESQRVTLLVVTSDASQHVIVTNSTGEKLAEEVAEQVLSLVRQFAA